MDVYEAIAARRTIRDFDGKPIPKATLLRILGAGLQAPSHDHLRQWRFILVKEPATRRALVSFFDEKRTQPELESMLEFWELSAECQKRMYLDAIPKQAAMIMEASALVVPCFRQPVPLLAEKGNLHELNAFASMWAVLENILIAAASEGIQGVTKVVSTSEEVSHIRQTLSIPEDQLMPCYLALGYANPRVDVLEQISVNPQDSLSIDSWTVQTD